MYRDIATRYLSAAVIPAALVMLSVTGSMAQQSGQASKPHWSVIHVTSVKPDMQEQFEVGMKELMAAFKKAGVRHDMFFNAKWATRSSM